MAIDEREVIEKYLESLEADFRCQRFEEASYLVVTTPYLYPNHDVVVLFIDELPDGGVEVSDGGEAEVQLFKHGFELDKSPPALRQAKQMAAARAVNFDGGTLAKSGPRDDMGSLMLDVIQVALGIANLRLSHPMFSPEAISSQ